MKKLLTKLSLIALSLIPARALAIQTFDPIYIPQRLRNGPLAGDLIVNTISILSFVAGVVTVIAIVIGGIMYSTSGGNESKTKTAKDTILYALIGLAVTISAYAIARFVQTGI